MRVHISGMAAAARLGIGAAAAPDRFEVGHVQLRGLRAALCIREVQLHRHTVRDAHDAGDDVVHRTICTGGEPTERHIDAAKEHAQYAHDQDVNVLNDAHEQEVHRCVGGVQYAGDGGVHRCGNGEVIDAIQCIHTQGAQMQQLRCSCDPNI